MNFLELHISPQLQLNSLFPEPLQNFTSIVHTCHLPFTLPHSFGPF